MILGRTNFLNDLSCEAGVKRLSSWHRMLIRGRGHHEPISPPLPCSGRSENKNVPVTTNDECLRYESLHALQSLSSWSLACNADAWSSPSSAPRCENKVRSCFICSSIDRNAREDQQRSPLEQHVKRSTSGFPPLGQAHTTPGLAVSLLGRPMHALNAMRLPAAARAKSEVPDELLELQRLSLQSMRDVKKGMEDDAIVRVIGSPPKPPEPEECCGSGCVTCVWTLHDEAQKNWEEKKRQVQEKWADQSQD